MEKDQVAVGGPFCGVRRRPKFLMRFYSFVRHLPIFWAFYAVLPVTASNWISVGDRITGLFFHGSLSVRFINYGTTLILTSTYYTQYICLLIMVLH